MLLPEGIQLVTKGSADPECTPAPGCRWFSSPRLAFLHSHLLLSLTISFSSPMCTCSLGHWGKTTVHACYSGDVNLSSEWAGGWGKDLDAASSPEGWSNGKAVTAHSLPWIYTALHIYLRLNTKRDLEKPWSGCLRRKAHNLALSDDWVLQWRRGKALKPLRAKVKIIFTGTCFTSFSTGDSRNTELSHSFSDINATSSE